MRAGPVETLVVDASVATKWHLTGEEHTDKVRQLPNIVWIGAYSGE